MSLNSSVAAVLASLSLLAIGTTTSIAQDDIETDYPNETQSSADANVAPAPAGSALLSQLATGSFDLGAPANIAGVLDYCNDKGLADNAAQKTADELIEAQGGREVLSHETEFTHGQTGILTSAQDRHFTLEDADADTARRLCARIGAKARALFLSGTE